ncbi:MAG: hypothetical protein ACK4N5_22485 [Myxococcales bacterium]
MARDPLALAGQLALFPAKRAPTRGAGELERSVDRLTRRRPREACDHCARTDATVAYRPPAPVKLCRRCHQWGGGK